MKIYKFKDGFDVNNQVIRIQFRIQWLIGLQGRIQRNFSFIELSYSRDSHGGSWIKAGIIGFTLLLGKY